MSPAGSGHARDSGVVDAPVGSAGKFCRVSGMRRGSAPGRASLSSISSGLAGGAGWGMRRGSRCFFAAKSPDVGANEPLRAIELEACRCRVRWRLVRRSAQSAAGAALGALDQLDFVVHRRNPHFSGPL